MSSSHLVTWSSGHSIGAACSMTVNDQMTR
jgi:hypothetical protein